MRVIVTGLVGMLPLGGVAWDYFQYVIGFYRMGYDAYYFEDTGAWPYHPIKNAYVDDAEYSVRFIKNYFGEFAPELLDRWHYRHLGDKTFGMTPGQIREILSTAELFINVSGANNIPEDLCGSAVKVFLDTDPGYNQIALSERPNWIDNIERWVSTVYAHDEFFTYAENIASETCSVPHLGLNWKTTRMPIIPELWESVASKPPKFEDPWVTIMTWNAFKGPLVYRGIEYHSKGFEFERILKLPTRCPLNNLKVALGGDAPVARLRKHGWLVEDGPSTTRTPRAYHEFIGGGRGEISTAKHVYVAMKTGWFSCRSVCFLAAERPVVVQDTGFSEKIACGSGLIAFTTLEEAVEGIHRVEADYAHHARRAGALAREFFDYRVVLGDLIRALS